MTFSCSRIALLASYFAFSLLFHFVEPVITPIDRRSIPNKVELKIRDIPSDSNSSRLNHPIVQTMGGILIGVVGLVLGGCFSLYCLRKRGYIHPSESAK